MTPARKPRKKGHSARQLTALAHDWQGAQSLEMPYAAIQYESYGSCPRESIDGPDASLFARPVASLVADVGARGGREPAPGPACGACPGRGLGAAPVDAGKTLRRQWGHADLRGPCQKSPTAWPICPDRAR